MKLYADAPHRRSLQIAGDVFLVVWIVAWLWIGATVHESTLALQEPAHRTETGATRLADSLESAGETLGDVPLIGGDIAEPFNMGRDAARDLAKAGSASAAKVERLAFWLRLSISLSPPILLAAFYLPIRVRFIRRATAGLRFINASADLDLFALRALVHQPVHILARISPDPVRSWRAGDPAMIRALAVLELQDVGLLPNRHVLLRDEPQ